MIIRLGTRQVPAPALLPVLCVVVCGLGFWRAIEDSTVRWVVSGALDPAYTLRHVNVLPQRYLDSFDALAGVHGNAMPAFLPGSTLITIPASLLIAYLAAPFFLRRAFTFATPLDLK